MESDCFMVSCFMGVGLPSGVKMLQTWMVMMVAEHINVVNATELYKLRWLK